MNFKNENTLRASLVVAGFSAMIVQIVFLRAFLGIFMGNELVAGVILGNWMILTAAGTRSGGWLKGNKNIFARIVFAQLLIAVLPQISILMMAIFKSWYYPPGVLPGFAASWLFSFLIMAPFCFISGALFSLFLKATYAISQTPKAPEIYGFEAIGSMVGGIIFSFLLLRYFTTFQILLLVAAANFGISLLLVLVLKMKQNYTWVIFIFWLMMTAINLAFDLDMITKTMIYQNQEIVLNKETPYGNLVITKTGNQFNFFENGTNLFSTDNVITNEESVHYAMVQHAAPKSVLLVSGSVSGMLKEISKYNVANIGYVEINPSLIEASKRFSGFDDPGNLQTYEIDARSFIKQTHRKFDVVLLNLPPPSTAQINCYFTQEFYHGLKSKLNPGAVISTSLDGSGNFLGKEAAALHGILYQTLKSVFTNVLIIQGQANYFLASDAPLETNIVERLENRGIVNDYVNKYYLADETIKMRALQLQQFLPADSPVNHDYKPVAYFARINYWLSWFGLKINFIALIVAIVFLVLFFLLKRQNRFIFAAGFSVSAIEIMILLAFQVAFGYFYKAVALLIAAFMAGLAVGTYLSEHEFIKDRKIKILLNQALIGVIGVIVPLFFMMVARHIENEFLLQFIFFLFMIIPGILTGMQFSWVSVVKGKDTSGNGSAAYSADLLGSAGGALLASAILIPLAGFLGTGLVLFGVNVLIILVNFIRKL